MCRSLANLNGELPPGLPHDVVQSIVDSLVKHSALNATTLRVLKNCELGSLPLAGCRGVTDEWLEPFTVSPPAAASCQHHPILPSPPSRQQDIDTMDLEDCYGTFVSSRHHHNDAIAEQASHDSRSTSSFLSANSNLADEPEDGLHNSPNNYNSGDTASLAVTTAVAAPPVEDITMMEDNHNYSSDKIDFSGAVAASMTLLDLRGSQRLTDKGLLQLSNLTALEVAKLDNCHAIVGRGLLAFSMSNRLHTLSLTNCRRLTDEAVVNVSHLVSLENLSLDGCRCLTDRSLAAISGLFGLRKLDLSQCDLITDAGLEHLEVIEHLEELSLGWCRSISNRGIDSLTAHPGRSEIKILRLARCTLTDEGVEFLGRLSGLMELDLNGCANIGGPGLGRALERMPQLQILDVSYCPGILRTSWQGKIPSLKNLELCYSGVKDSHLSKLINLPALEEINLDSCPVGDWAIAHLADNNVVPNLKSLDLADTDITDLGMVHLPTFQKLTRLSLFYCNISNGGLRHIAELKELEVLNLDSREISDNGLSHLRNLQNLRCLDIFSGRVTDSGCAHISRIKSLESLELCGGGVGDLGCTLIAGLENLTSLNLSQNERITNPGASALAVLKNLKALNLSNTRVDAAAHLRLPKSLQSLALYGCRGIEDANGLSLLQTDLPSLKCLRLNSMSNEDGMMVGVEIPPDDDALGGLGPTSDLPARLSLGQPMAAAEAVANTAGRVGIGGRDDGDRGSQNSMMEEDDESFFSDHD